MRLQSTSLDDLDRAIAECERSDYIYMYPPRQAYRPFGREDDVVNAYKIRSLRKHPVNVYVHIPFCRQICAFCNLYATTVRSSVMHDRYVIALRAQVRELANLMDQTTQVPTVYLGGGTPTALPISDLIGLAEAIRSLLPGVTSATEFALEADPQTVDDSSLRLLADAGYRRISYGFQSKQASEIRGIGRRTEPSVQDESVIRALEAGFQNVCVDLIYGLPAQTVSSWASSVQQCIDLGPQTICCYPLTLRPHTGFGRTLLHGAIGRGSYDLWHRADTLLQEAGYARETHVRWSLPGGGYLQKQLHWGMQNLVGLGAGARSYLWHLDIRYGYSVTRRVEPLRLYLASSEAGEPQAIDGFQMDDDERLRKAVTLGLFQLDRMHVTALTGLDPWVVFAREFTGLVDRGLAYSDEKTFTLTEAGVPYRDLIAQLFFSDRVKELVQTHSYDE